VGGSLGAQLETSSSSHIPAQAPAKLLPPASATFTAGSGNLISPEGTLNVTTLQAEGAKAKAQSYQKFQDEVDHIIM
jgi:hypothetical protein